MYTKYAKAPANAVANTTYTSNILCIDIDVDIKRMNRIAYVVHYLTNTYIILDVILMKGHR